MRILKYEVLLEGTFSIEMPNDGVILSMQVQHNIPYIWVQVGSNMKLNKRNFRILTTGEAFDIISSKERYIGTFQLNVGSFVGHLFEL